MKRLVTVILMLSQLSFSLEDSSGKPVSCELSHESMVLIAKTEKHPKRRLGYPYLISFNNESDAKKVYQRYQVMFIPNKGVDRSIDCVNEETCVNVLQELITQGIDNVDLGGFQINYRHHKLRHEYYFRVAESYEYACSYAYGFVRKHGETFKSLAMYHSQTPKYRNIYAKRMYDEYKKSQ